MLEGGNSLDMRKGNRNLLVPISELNTMALVPTNWKLCCADQCLLRWLLTRYQSHNPRLLTTLGRRGECSAEDVPLAAGRTSGWGWDGSAPRESCSWVRIWSKLKVTHTRTSVQAFSRVHYYDIWCQRPRVEPTPIYRIYVLAATL